MIHPAQVDWDSKMRGTDEASGSLFNYVDFEARIRQADLSQVDVVNSGRNRVVRRREKRHLLRLLQI